MTFRRWQENTPARSAKSFTSFCWFTLSVLLAVVTQLACYAQSTCRAGSSWTEYGGDGISFRMPEGWRVMGGDTPEATSLIVLPQGATPEQTPCSLLLQWVHKPSGRTLEAAADWYFNEMRRSHPGSATRGASVRLSIANTPALVTAFTGPGDDGTPMTGLLYTMLSARELFVILSTGDTAEWELAKQTLETIVKSVRWKRAALTEPQTQNTRSRLPADPGVGRYEDPDFSFQYPADWRIPEGGVEAAVTLRGDRSGRTFKRVRLDAPEEAATVFVLYGTGPNISCGDIVQNLGGHLNVEYTKSYFDNQSVPESAAAGQVFTTRFTRNPKAPGTEVLTSIVCGFSRTAVIVFGYPSGYPRVARDMMLRTLSFGGSKPSVLGSWEGEGSLLTFTPDGNVQLSSLGSIRSFTNRGTYKIVGSTLTVMWTVQNGIRSAEQWNCEYSLDGGALRMNRNHSGNKVYRRSSLQ